MPSIHCPDCQIEISLPEDARPGHIEICGNCAAEIEVTSIDPIEVKTIEEEK